MRGAASRFRFVATPSLTGYTDVYSAREGGGTIRLGRLRRVTTWPAGKSGWVPPVATWAVVGDPERRTYVSRLGAATRLVELIVTEALRA